MLFYCLLLTALQAAAESCLKEGLCLVTDADADSAVFLMQSAAKPSQRIRGYPSRLEVEDEMTAPPADASEASASTLEVDASEATDEARGSVVVAAQTTSELLRQKIFEMFSDHDGEIFFINKSVPHGSDVWSTERWIKVSEWHPSGVASNVGPLHLVRWHDYSYISISMTSFLCAVAYPAVLVASLLGLTVLVSMCLTVEDQYMNLSEEAGGADAEPPQNAEPERAGSAAGLSAGGAGEEDILQQYIERLPVLPTHKLTPTSRMVYAIWQTVCCAVPSIMVFGTPLLMMLLARPFPQEVLASLTLLTSIFVFSNTMYMFLFAGLGLSRMTAQAKMDPASICRAQSDTSPGSGSKSLNRRTIDPTVVKHWIILPQYKEDIETVAISLRSAARSSIAKSSITVLLAMEERETGAEGKVAKLIEMFKDDFEDIQANYHPVIPGEPPGKASNVSHAFKKVVSKVESFENTVLTVADADSEFGAGYFESLAWQFAECSPTERYKKIWQAPVFHMKNYHRQPAPVVVGTMFTAMQELAALSDPNAVRFPYSTYSLSIALARRVGGWDAAWIAEDYHMGIKCFLMTLGETSVEPVMSPVVNYVPEAEDNDWWGNCMARWVQLKRHALGFSDFSYYFMMLPLVFSYSSTRSSFDSAGLQGFWRMLSYGTSLLIRLVNVHVLIGVLSTYGAMEFGLKILIKLFFRRDRGPDLLFLHVGEFPTMLMCVTVVFTILVSCVFFQTYLTLLKQKRLDDEPPFSHGVHWMKNLVGLAIGSPFYFVMLGYAIWRAAIMVLTQRSFEYHVAPKPKQADVAKPPGRDGKAA
mmetsp:Transcript_7971/g.18473  ORF Transcript_7971/g.18473 Transcript_7971/m.18473 type:complete len:815 (-) Transcript_7971:105-2549(-)